jgi:hypothetical protein
VVSPIIWACYEDATRTPGRAATSSTMILVAVFALAATAKQSTTTAATTLGIPVRV